MRASIVIPTRARLAYLRVALDSIAPQAGREDVEVLVVEDAPESAPVRELARRMGARYEPNGGALGLNVARNTGVARSTGELVVFVDDDVRAGPEWLAALLRAAAENRDVDVFTGPIRPALEGPAPRGCGRESAPLTTLDLGPVDTDARFAWGANMAIRRSALERVGPFEEALADGGDEQEWQERLRVLEPGARVLYVAQAAVDHRRAGADARLRALARAAAVRGAAARRFDARRGLAPPLWAEARTLAGCAWHVIRRRCPAGMAMVAHSAARLGTGLREGLAGAQHPRANGASPPGPADDFLSGASGTVGGLDGLRRAVADGTIDAIEAGSGRRMRLALAARRAPPRRRVLVIGVERPAHARRARAARAELARSRHDVEFDVRAPGDRGKFENLNLLLAAHTVADRDWLLVLDDDVDLCRGFLDRFLFLCERFSLSLAQPAHRLDSHAAWSVTRRRRGSVVRETNFVEIGPVTAFARRTFPTLLPFPELRMGWGLDAHWAALARAGGWRCGVTDAVPMRHRAAPVAGAYPREDAIAEARAFLAQRPYVVAEEAERTLATHRAW
jgi:GT2 family glycosyltransferase